MNQDEILLSIRGLSVSFFTEGGVMPAVQDVGFSIKKGRTFALVGESGCGKTTVALSILRLLPRPAMGHSRKAGALGGGKIVSGEIVFEGQNLLSLSEKQMRRIRGGKIAMIFQEPMTSLNPVYRVGDQIVEAIKLHSRESGIVYRESARSCIVNRESGVEPRITNHESRTTADAVEMLRKVGIADPEQRVRQYPHQMSGGMQQRVMIAMAASCQPKLLIADEPTTALDVTTQAQILDLLDQLQQAGMSILLITHDLGIVAERADDVAVMYASRIVEMAPKGQLFKEPYHPYTQGLLQSLPGHGLPARENMAKMAMLQRLQTIPGTLPEPLHFPSGCKFHPRCRIGSNDTRCQTVEPMLKKFEIRKWHRLPACENTPRMGVPQFEIAPRWVACWYAPGYFQVN